MWQTELVELLRVLVNDLDSTLYTDERLRRTIISAAFQVLREGVTFAYEFDADLGDQDITPDPTEPESKDEDFMNLICIKAGCIINRGDAAKASRQAIAVKDGTSAIDLRDTLKGALALLDKSWCQVYDEEILAVRIAELNMTAGAAVLGPFRLIAREYFGWSTANAGWPTQISGGITGDIF